MKIKDIIVGFLKKFLPLLSCHIIVCAAVGALMVTAAYGADSVKDYYVPLLISAAIAVLLSVLAYSSFFSNSGKYDSSRLGDFDKTFVYGRFGGRDSAKLREAVIDMHLFDLNTALEKFKELEEKNLTESQRSVLCFYMGRCYQLMGYPSNGAKYFEQALEYGLELNDTYLLAARCLVQNGRYDKAVEYYNILLDRSCYFDFIYTDIGIAYLKKGDGEKALEYFNKSLDEGKNYSFALGGCSLAYLLMKDLEKSREYYKKALTCNMDDVNGFKIFYCNIAESVDLLDEIDPNMKLRTETPEEVIR